ncbi:uncharacterized protein LOC107403435 isoform X2 [Ziziphus jujuba]|uniref:Uncharacterized protein LOC107403435 isoform X2 n=1 Tax=Ziziphus jujuba TaxID=326968 RepID=A0A6P6GDE9_ZIZJJ|nr:uncharacterized protein LOC107403435 isoform X2 [Ziziphus jujuba]
MVAASLLLPSTSFKSYRMKKVCQDVKSCHWQKGFAFFSVSNQKHSCCNNFKLYRIPVRSFASHYGLRTFASVGSLQANVVGQGNRVSSPTNFQRSEASFEATSKSVDDMKNFERQLEELFDEVKRMIMMGNKNDAIDLLQANYEAVKERINAGARGMEEAAVLDIIALGYVAVGDLKVVGKLLDMLNEVVDSLKDDEPLLDPVLVHMGSMYLTLGKFEKSVFMYQRAITIMESKFGKMSVYLVTPILGMAKVLGSLGRATKAVEFYHRSITILESCRSTENEDLIVPLFGLGNLLLKEGKPMEAESPFLRILNIYTKLYGDHDGRVGMVMCSLAHVKCAMGNANEAIHLYRKALQVIKDSNYVALDDSTMEKMRIDLAELLHVVGRGKEGREILEECLLISEKSRGKENPSSVTHLVNLATSYSRSKNYAQAEHLLRTSLEIMKKTVGPDDQSITFPMLHLAVNLYHLRRDEEAEELALKALHIREKAFGKDSLPVAEALDCLVSIQTRLEKDDEVLLEQLKRILSIQEKEFGIESDEVLITLKKVAFYLDKLGRRNEKFSVQKRLSNLKMKFKQQIKP